MIFGVGFPVTLANRLVNMVVLYCIDGVVIAAQCCYILVLLIGDPVTNVQFKEGRELERKKKEEKENE